MVTLPPPNQQCLDIQSTPRAEMNLFPLDTFPYEFPGREIKINFEITEFTAICPFSDFPDFATIRLEYVPNERCIELKSLKFYINSFRNIKIFHEHVVNIILEDFVAACDPLRVDIEGRLPRARKHQDHREGKLRQTLVLQTMATLTVCGGGIVGCRGMCLRLGW